MLNQLREARGLNSITLRPHCGESGDVNHLAGAYLCASSINHGIGLANSAVLQVTASRRHIEIGVAKHTNNGTVYATVVLHTVAPAHLPLFAPRAAQYLYYVDRVGLSVSPISNHFLFLKAPKSDHEMTPNLGPWADRGARYSRYNGSRRPDAEGLAARLPSAALDSRVCDPVT